MQDKAIKIIYNWIGPRGPIPNTEVPNLLNLASVGERTSTDSLKFWCDSIWHLIFCNQPGFTLAPTHYTGDKDIFIYPFHLPWRVNFVDYFYNNSGILEYSHTNNDILYCVRNRGGFILIEDAAEAHVQPVQLQAMHTYFNSNNIPLNKIIYLTGCMNAEEIYNDFLAMNGITNDKMNIFSFPVSQESLANNYFNNHKPNVPDYDTERVPEKLFLSWNRRYRQHRVALVYGLDKLGLLDKSHVAIGITDPENPNKHITNQLNDVLLGNLFQITQEDKENLLKKLPLILDGETDNNQMCQDFNDATRPFYQSSLISLITETNFDDLEVSLTEKSFKPVKEKHPFISIGATGTLQALRNMGFKTFGEFWDESYDDIKHPAVRMTRILQICQEISTWDNEKILNFRRNVKPILDYNYENLKIRFVDKLTVKIKDRIFDIIKEKYQGVL